MRKIYILDTNIILHDPLSFYSFEGNDVVIPLYVIEELDNFKENQDALGQNARMFSRRMDDYMSEGGDLSKGIFIDDHDISLLVESNKKIEVELPQELSISKKDNSILSVAIYYNNKFDEEVILVSNDTNLKIKANSIGLKIESYKSNAVELETLYKGYKDIDTVSQEDVDLLHKKDKLKINIEDAQPNEVYNIKTNKSSTLSIYKKNYLHKLDHDIYAWGINANNREQNYGLNLLMDKDIDLVSLVGKAGTGKTLLSLAAGLEQVVNRKEYTKLVILRPIIPMGKDIGYLPGDEQEKLSAWMRPIKDNLEFLLSGQDKDISQSYIDNYISMEALTYIRG
ncbi:MAG: PhoH family protein, partial [Candidatus Woesearchaeota archaeon]